MLSIIQQFNAIDWFLLVIMLLCVISGWQKGFILGAVDLVRWILVVVISFSAYKYAAALIEKFTTVFGVWLFPVSFLFVFFISSLLLSLLVRMYLNSVPVNTQDNFINKFMGIVPGFFNGIIYLIILVAMLLPWPLFDGLSAKTRDSYIASRLSDKVEWIDSKISPVFDKAVRKTMNRVTVEPGSEQTVKLLYTLKDPKVRPDLEAKMLDMVNKERIKAGLTVVKADPEMTEVARAHSRDMFARGYFSHYTPEGKDPFDRIKAANVSFLTAGENLALGQTLNICHDALMRSPGHRANILRPAFGRLGIGILDGGMYGLMISQEFRN